MPTTVIIIINSEKKLNKLSDTSGQTWEIKRIGLCMYKGVCVWEKDR